MKNLMIYISPTGSFDNPRADLASNDGAATTKVQIENSLSLGWKKEDIMLVTNFPFTYAGIKAKVLDDVDFFERKPQVSKINAIIKLFETRLIKKNEMYWFHDLDAFQLVPSSDLEIDIKDSEIAMTDFGGAKHFLGEDRWSGGIVYFKLGSRDLFEKIREVCYQKRIDEEEAVGILTINDPKIRKRVKKINSSYNFIGYNFKSAYEKSIKPMKVVHFHPLVAKKRHGNINGFQFFNGKNPLNISLLTPKLIKFLKYHRLA